MDLFVVVMMPGGYFKRGMITPSLEMRPRSFFRLNYNLSHHLSAYEQKSLQKKKNIRYRDIEMEWNVLVNSECHKKVQLF